MPIRLILVVPIGTGVLREEYNDFCLVPDPSVSSRVYRDLAIFSMIVVAAAVGGDTSNTSILVSCVPT